MTGIVTVFDKSNEVTTDILFQLIKSAGEGHNGEVLNVKTVEKCGEKWRMKYETKAGN